MPQLEGDRHRAGALPGRRNAALVARRVQGICASARGANRVGCLSHRLRLVAGSAVPHSGPFVAAAARWCRLAHRSAATLSERRPSSFDRPLLHACHRRVGRACSKRADAVSLTPRPHEPEAAARPSDRARSRPCAWLACQWPQGSRVPGGAGVFGSRADATSGPPRQDHGVAFATAPVDDCVAVLEVRWQRRPCLLGGHRLASLLGRLGMLCS